MNGRNALAAVMLIIFVCVSAALVHLQSSAIPVGVALPSGTALFETSLQSAISTTDTSMTLVSVSLRGSETLTGYQCFTIDEGRSDAEYVCGTVSGSTVSSLERGLSLSTGTTTITALKFRHRTGADVKITDYPLIQRMRSQLNGSDTIPNLLSYSAGTDCSPGHGTAVLCTGSYLEAYANAVIAGGAPTSTTAIGGKVLLATQLQMASSTDLGATAPLVIQSKYATSSPGSAGLWAVITNNAGKIAQAFLDLTASYAWTGAHTFAALTTFTGQTSFTATSTVATTTNTIAFKPQFYLIAGETISGGTTPQPIFIATSTNKAYLSQANDTTFDREQFQGFAVTSASANGQVLVQTSGVISGFTGLTTGADYYVQDSVGTIGTSLGTAEVHVGQAISATQLYMTSGTGLQYLGSQSIPATGYTKINQPLARVAIAQVTAVSTGCSSFGGTITIAKVGKTTATVNGTCAVPNSNGFAGSTFTWISTTGNAASSSIQSSVSNEAGAGTSNTVYYYR